MEEIKPKGKMTREDYENRKQVKLSSKFGKVRDEIKSEEELMFGEWGDLDLKDNFDKIIECLIEGYDIKLCLQICFKKTMTGLFKHFQEIQEDHVKFVEARMFSVNKIMFNLMDHLKMYKKEPVLYNASAEKYIRMVKEIGKTDLLMKSKIESDKKKKDNGEFEEAF